MFQKTRRKESAFRAISADLGTDSGETSGTKQRSQGGRDAEPDSRTGERRYDGHLDWTPGMRKKLYGENPFEKNRSLL